MKTKGIRLTKDVLDAALAGGTILGGGGGPGPDGVAKVEGAQAGHHRVQVGLGLFHQHLLQVQDLLDDGGDLFLYI